MFLVMGVIMAVVFLPTTVLLAIGMLPTVVAYISDQSRAKIFVVTVGAMNLAGCFPFVIDLWLKGNGFDQSMQIISNPTTIIVMYAAAMMGYLIDWSISGVVAGMVYQRGLKRMKSIQDRQAELVERWGPEVTNKESLDKQGFFKSGTAAAKEKGA